MDLCQEDNTLFEGSVALITCSVRGVISNFNLRDGLTVLCTILEIFLRKFLPLVIDIAEWFLGPLVDTPTDVAYEGFCKDEIKFSFPNSWGQCINQTLMACHQGEPVTTPVVKSLVASTKCVINELLTNAPGETIEAIFCDFVDAGEVLASWIPGGQLLYNFFLGNLCD
ncbi:uncharacterized protein LOC144139521 [Haemaphysalis longicornis]